MHALPTFGSTFCALANMAEMARARRLDDEAAAADILAAAADELDDIRASQRRIELMLALLDDEDED